MSQGIQKRFEAIGSAQADHITSNLLIADIEISKT